MQNQFLPPETTAAPAISPVTTQMEPPLLENESPQTAALVAERLALLKRKQRRHHRRFLLYMGSLLTSILLLFASIPVLLNQYPDNPSFVFLPVFLAFATIAGGLRWFGAGAKPLIDAEELTRLGGVKAIGTLFQMWEISIASKDRNAITDALIQLLPQLKASDASLIQARHRTLLNQQLTSMARPVKMHARYYDFAVAILAAYEQVGSADDLPVVQKLAQMKSHTPDQERVREAAALCLPALEASLSNAQSSRTLLRAAAPVIAAPDSLLRPAQFTPDPNSAQLLHPAVSARDGANE